MLFGFRRFARKLRNQVIKIGDSIQASLFVILGHLEVVMFLLMLESKLYIVSIHVVSMLLFRMPVDFSALQ